LSIEQQLIDYFKDNAGVDITPDTPLAEEGVVDSMGVMELLGFVESAFGVTPEMDDLTVENFGTVNDIKNFVLSKRPDL
jgi:acyl carrier protein